MTQALKSSIHTALSFHSVPAGHPAHEHAQTLETVKDIAAGIALILEMKELNDLDRQIVLDSDDPQNEQSPVLGINDSEVLMRLALASARMLHDNVERSLFCLNERVRSEHGE